MIAVPENKSTSRTIPIFVAVLLLVIAARAFAQQQQMQLDIDEVWAIWMTEGTPQEIIARTPSDWPPLYFLLMGFWQRVAGITELAMRYLAVLIFTFGSAAMYRVSTWGCPG